MVSRGETAFSRPLLQPSGHRGSAHHVNVLLLPRLQPTQHRTGHRRGPVGQPLADGRRLDVVQAAGVDDHLHTLRQEERKEAGPQVRGGARQS